MAKKRLTRKQLLKEPDEFITTTGRVIQWARANTKPLTYGAIGFFAVVILVALFSYYQERQAQKASLMLGQSAATYRAEMSAGKADKALASVRADFEQLIDAYDGQPAGRLGRVVFAHICLTGGAYDDAVMHYRRALDDFSGDPSLESIILNGLGSALQHTGDDNGAVSTYQQLVNTQSTALKDVALFNLGLIYEKQGKMDQMKRAYEQLAADFPDSAYTNLVRERL